MSKRAGGRSQEAEGGGGGGILGRKFFRNVLYRVGQKRIMGVGLG